MRSSRVQRTYISKSNLSIISIFVGALKKKKLMGQNFVKTFDVLAIVKALRCKIIREIILSTMSSIFEEVVRSKQIMTLANIPWFDSRFMNLGS